MEVLQRSSESLDDGPCIFFIGLVGLLRLQEGIERDPLKILHDDVEVVVGLHNIQDLDDVGMVQHLQDADFPPN